MKRFIAVTVIAAMIFSVITGCKNESENEETTTAVMTIEHQTTAEETKESTTGIIDEGTIVINKGKYNLKFEKTDFDKIYPEEVLDEISRFIPMEYGCDDYDNWDGTPNEIINDIYYCCSRFLFDSYDYGSREWEKAIAEMNKNPIQNEYFECFFMTVEDINSFLRDFYGPNARKFKVEDFDVYSDIKNENGNIFEDYDYFFRVAYLPESEMVVCLCAETFGGELEPTYICDIRMSNGDYIVEVVSDTYYIYCVKYLMTIACEPNGNIYVKSVDDFYVFPEGVENNRRVVSDDNVKVEAQKYNSGEWVVIDTISDGEEVYSTGKFYFDESYAWIITEEYRGRVEKKYLTKIE